MIAFERLRARTFCPFARKSKVRYTRVWNDAVDYAANIENQAKDLEQFVDEQDSYKAHGYVSQIRLGARSSVFESVKREFARYLVELSKHDTSCRACLQQDIVDKQWQFTFKNARLFLNVFAPCYDGNHSKYIEDRDSIYIFFQPEGSFDLCGIDSSNVATRISIRSAFAENGSGYSAELIDARVEAAIYMFPRSEADEPVAWWDHLS